MKGFLNILIGFGIIILVLYTAVVSVQIIFGYTEKTFDDISVVLVFSLFFVGIFVYSFIKEHWKKPEEPKSTNNIAEESPLHRPYTSLVDKLVYGHYEQASETWWSDSDGDSHSRETVYATLRFYENGTVIGIRKKTILKEENSNSFVYKGTFTIEEDKVNFNLDKVVDVDDAIDLHISEEEERDMKYAGHITHDHDIIKNGYHVGTIRDKTLYIGSMVFNAITPSRLVITASESSCDALKSEFTDHPLVIGSYTDTGNWYTNGETGPEWHTVTFLSRYELKEQLENDIQASSHDYQNIFWG